ncbi:MAG: Pr6Pr family membrane protein [Actinomycetota bacterium]|nr:Pr6Pr family membrane protein [Actinomycetota bacterium]
MTDRPARVWFGLTAVAVFVGNIVQVFVSANAQAEFFHTPGGRVFNVFCFFTIQSNLIVGVTSLLLALNPRRSSTVFNTFRLTGVVAIAVTGVVFHAVLARLLDLESWALVANNLVHTVVPVMGVLGWLIFGPHGLTSRRVMWLSILYPIAWLIFTLIRGPIVHFYPYPFVDVIRLGYARVLVNCVWVSVLYLGLAAGAVALDRRLDRLDRRLDRSPTAI